MLSNNPLSLQEDILLNSKRQKTDVFSYDLIVFSHLKWGFVYQRPQHVISRISKDYRTLFIEEPAPSGQYDGIGFEIETVSPTLSVLKPKVNSIAEISRILAKLGIDRIEMAWFYSPAFAGMLDCISAEFVVYDCVNEASMFKGNPLALIEGERRLLEAADLTLTAGNSLNEAKSYYCANVHCFPSSVDHDHFKKARGPVEVPEDIKNIKGPIVGYMGTIDERVDMNLVQQTAELMPDHSFVLIGPWSKLKDEDLARAGNIHYLGMKLYQTLPNYLKAFDAAMIPFVLSEATHFINPAKTLEYMAAGVPVISTPITDVVYHYGDCVEIIDSPRGFKKAVEKATAEPLTNYQEGFDKILKETSWDHTASEILKLMKMIA